MEGSVNVNLVEPAVDAETVRIILDRKVSPGGSVQFSGPDDASGWPLIEKLFQLENVHSVLAQENVLVVARKPNVGWDALLPDLERTIRGHYDANPDGDERIHAAPTAGVADAAGAAGVDENSIRQRVQQIIDTEINPNIASHGGFIRLLDVQGTRIFVQLGGGCQGCGMAHVTLREGVEHLIRARVPEITEILDATDHAAGASPFYSK